MSLQKALNVIEGLKNNPKLVTHIRTLDDLLKHLEKEQLKLSKQDLNKSFVLDWKMRWVKHSR